MERRVFRNYGTQRGHKVDATPALAESAFSRSAACPKIGYDRCQTL